MSLQRIRSLLLNRNAKLEGEKQNNQNEKRDLFHFSVSSSVTGFKLAKRLSQLGGE